MEKNIEYRRPPIVERAASIYSDMSEENFERKFEEWRVIVSEAYPVYEPIKQWKLNVLPSGDPSDPIPVFSSSQPELIITPRFSRRTSTEGFDFSLRCPRGQFMMNMHPSPSDGSGRRFSQLRKDFLNWSSQWMDHFGVTSLKSLVLHYVNALNHTTVPTFILPDGRLKLGEVITLFKNIKGAEGSLVPPLSFEANILLPASDDSILKILVQESSHHLAKGLTVQFIVTIQPKLRATRDEIPHLLDYGHSCIVSKFESIFSEEAKKSFDPVII